MPLMRRLVSVTGAFLIFSDNTLPRETLDVLTPTTYSSSSRIISRYGLSRMGDRTYHTVAGCTGLRRTGFCVLFYACGAPSVLQKNTLSATKYERVPFIDSL